MNDVLALQVVERQRHLTEVESDSVFTELDTLLQVVAQISTQQEVHHHKHVLFVLEGVPGVKERSHCSLCTQWGWKAKVQTETERTNRHHLQAAASMQPSHTAGTPTMVLIPAHIRKTFHYHASVSNLTFLTQKLSCLLHMSLSARGRACREINARSHPKNRH